MKKRRLFFGLVPGDGIQLEIVNAAKMFPTTKGVRPVSKDKLHLTLLFLGDVEENGFKCLEQKMLQTYVQPFSLRLNLFGYFKKPKVIWLGCTSFPNELIRLVNHLKNMAQQCGVKVDDKHYKPHITLYKKASESNFPDDPVNIKWNVTEFHLIESVPHENATRYNIVSTFNLSESI